MEKIERHYSSAAKSKKFWKVIDSLSGDRQSAAYSLGVALQNLETELFRLIEVEISKDKLCKIEQSYKSAGRGRIVEGTPISHDFHYYTWPKCCSPEVAKNPDMIFDVVWDGDFWKCTADGYGHLKSNGDVGNYGSGCIRVRDFNGVKLIEEPETPVDQTTLDLAESRVEERGEVIRRLRDDLETIYALRGEDAQIADIIKSSLELSKDY